MPKNENPFENIPDDFADAQAAVKTSSATKQAETPSRNLDFKDLARLSPRIANRGIMAMGAGAGFVLLIVLVYLGMVVQDDENTYIFGIAGMVLSTLVAFFFMLDDLRIRPRKVMERGTKFIAGVMWMLLLILTFFMTGAFWPNYLQLFLLYAIFVLTNASFALFFYSMLWED